MKTTRRQARLAARPASGRNWLAIGGFVALVIAAATWMYVQDQRAKQKARERLDGAIERFDNAVERDMTDAQREQYRSELEKSRQQREREAAPLERH